MDKYQNSYTKEKSIKSLENIHHHPPPLDEMLEKEVEKALVKETKRLGGLCWKFTSSVVGVPDRLCLFAFGKVAFVEVKRPGEVLRPIQIKRKKQLEELGFKVYVLDSKEKVQEVINDINN